MSKDQDLTGVEQILLTEIRLNRTAIANVDAKVNKLDRQVFSNKMKLGFFIAGLSIFFNIIIAVIIKKLEIYLA